VPIFSPPSSCLRRWRRRRRQQRMLQARSAFRARGRSAEVRIVLLTINPASFFFSFLFFSFIPGIQGSHTAHTVLCHVGQVLYSRSQRAATVSARASMVRLRPRLQDTPTCCALVDAAVSMCVRRAPPCVRAPLFLFPRACLVTKDWPLESLCRT
jgi:hypothetical protein